VLKRLAQLRNFTLHRDNRKDILRSISYLPEASTCANVNSHKCKCRKPELKMVLKKTLKTAPHGTS
jgi:histidinol phosphatase-like enzyme